MLLSVIVPVYNVEPYLNRCVQSIVRQTYKDLEIILVDDGSTDRSPEMCDLWAGQDARIKVIHKKNGGLSSARNAGIDIAQGEVLSFIDSDDFIEPDMYQTMIFAMVESGKDIVCCGRIVDLWGEREKRDFSRSSPKIYSKEDAMKEVLCLRDIDTSAWDKVYKKSLFAELRYPVGKISEDAAIILQILNESNGIFHVGKSFYHYVFRENSISKKTFTQNKHDVYINCVNMASFISKNHPELMMYVKIYSAQVCTGLLECMYISNAINQYKELFDAYRKMLKSGIWILIKQKALPIKLKVRCFLIFVKKIKLYWALKRFYTKIKSLGV